jgi:hypothetical protein
MDLERPVLIGSCGSSGSTLLSIMLHAHPDLLCGPELALFGHPFVWRQAGSQWRERLQQYLRLGYDVIRLPEWTPANGVCPYANLVYDNTLPWYGLTVDRLADLIGKCADGRELARAIYEPLLRQQGKRRWIEKSPQNVYAFQAFLDAYPEGRVVYLVRDVRDVVGSLMRKGWGGFKRTLSYALVDTALCETFRDHPRAHRVRYEDLVRHPADTVAKLLDFLGASPDVDRVLNFHKESSRAVSVDPSSVGQPTWHHAPTQPIGEKGIGAWKGMLSAEHLACLDAATIVSPIEGYGRIVGESAAQLLARLGYEPSPAGPADAETLHRLILDERLFLSGRDYAFAGLRGTAVPEWHATLVECASERLPKIDGSWEEKRLSAKLAHVREECVALWTANRERQAELGALREEHRRLLAVPFLRLLFRMHQLPYREWPHAVRRKLRARFRGDGS